MQDIWKNLTYDFIFLTIEEILNKKLTNLILQRNSYINRVFELVTDNQEKLIVKFYRPLRWTKEAILAEHAFLQELANQEITVILPITIQNQTLFEKNGYFFSIFPKMGGRVLDELDHDSWTLIGRLLARTHKVGEKLKLTQRQQLTPEHIIKNSLPLLLTQPNLSPDFQRALENQASLFLKIAIPLFKNEPRMLIHGDCHLGNLIHRPDNGIFLIDFDDCCIGPIIQDLWLLLPSTPDKCEREINWFSEGYDVFADFPHHSLKLIPLLRIMRRLYFAAWCALQRSDYNFEATFPEWGSTQYWNELITDIQEGISQI